MASYKSINLSAAGGWIKICSDKMELEIVLYNRINTVFDAGPLSVPLISGRSHEPRRRPANNPCIRQGAENKKI